MVSNFKATVQPHGGAVNWVVGTGLALAAFGLYLATLALTVLEADGGEFQFVPWLPGIAHPTGYPLYILLGWLWTHLLPFGVLVVQRLPHDLMRRVVRKITTSDRRLVIVRERKRLPKKGRSPNPGTLDMFLMSSS